MELDAEDVDFFRDPNEHHSSGIVSRISIFDTAYAPTTVPWHASTCFRA